MLKLVISCKNPFKKNKKAEMRTHQPQLAINAALTQLSKCAVNNYDKMQISGKSVMTDFVVPPNEHIPKPQRQSGDMSNSFPTTQG